MSLLTQIIFFILLSLEAFAGPQEEFRRCISANICSLEKQGFIGSRQVALQKVTEACQNKNGNKAFQNMQAKISSRAENGGSFWFQVGEVESISMCGIRWKQDKQPFCDPTKPLAKLITAIEDVKDYYNIESPIECPFGFVAEDGQTCKRYCREGRIFSLQGGVKTKINKLYYNDPNDWEDQSYNSFSSAMPMPGGSCVSCEELTDGKYPATNDDDNFCYDSNHECRKGTQAVHRGQGLECLKTCPADLHGKPDMDQVLESYDGELCIYKPQKDCRLCERGLKTLMDWQIRSIPTFGTCSENESRTFVIKAKNKMLTNLKEKYQSCLTEVQSQKKITVDCDGSANGDNTLLQELIFDQDFREKCGLSAHEENLFDYDEAIQEIDVSGPGLWEFLNQPKWK